MKLIGETNIRKICNLYEVIRTKFKNLYKIMNYKEETNN